MPFGHVLKQALAFVLFSLLSFNALAAVKIGTSDWPGWVAWYVAKDKGFFKKYGADVELVWFPNYTDSIQALSAGKLDANSQTWSDSMAPLAAHVPIKLVLINDNSAGNDAVMVKPEIKTFADLKGKTVALEEFSISHFVLVTALSKNKMSADDVKVLNLSAGDAAAAFLAGRVDAATVWNPWVNRIQESGKGHALFTSKDMPGLIPDALVAQEKALEDPKKRKDFVGMIRAWYDTVDFIHKNPAEAAKIMAKVVGVDAKEYQKYLSGTRFFEQQDNLEAFAGADQPKSLLAVAPTIIQFLKEHKLIEGEPDYAKGLDASLIKVVAGVK